MSFFFCGTPKDNMNTEQLFKIIKDIWQFLNSPILALKGTTISLSSIALAFVTIWISFRIANFLGRMLNGALEKKAVDSGVRDSLEKFLRYLVIVIGILFAADIMGFSLSSLAALSAILMVGIGFGLQNITQNFISGIILLIERPVKVGDIVKVGDVTGKIFDIRVRATVIQTRDDISIIVPNSKFIAEEVVNQSFLGQRIRKHVRVGVAYGSELKVVQATLLKVAADHPEILDDPEPTVIFENFGDSSLEFDLRFWSSSLWDIERICSDIRFAIDEAFRIQKIQIPFPQRDLYVKEIPFLPKNPTP